MLTVSAVGRWILAGLGKPRREKLALAVESLLKDMSSVSLLTCSSGLVQRIERSHMQTRLLQQLSEIISSNLSSRKHMQSPTWSTLVGHVGEPEYNEKRLRFC